MVSRGTHRHFLLFEILAEVLVNSVDLLLSISRAELDLMHHDVDQANSPEYHWHTIVSWANEIVAVVQHCKADYAIAVDPFNCYIVLLAALIIVLEPATLPLGGEEESQPLPTLDVLELFLAGAGRHWELGESWSPSRFVFANIICSISSDGSDCLGI